MPISGDLSSYFLFAQKIFQGGLPYKDFFIEYPPLSLPFFIIAYISPHFILIHYLLNQLFLLILKKAQNFQPGWQIK